MEKVPKMISTKDLDYLSDMLNWNLVIAKKAHHFANKTTKKEITEELDEVANMHSKHYEIILDLLYEEE